MAGYRVSIDIGGTFTDFVVSDDTTGEVRVGKVPTTPSDLSEGVIAGLVDIVPEPSAIRFIVHGTTIGLNTFLERKGARVLLITTAGFRDSYIIARGDRRELYALQYRKPARLVPRRDVHEVRERMAWDGTELEALQVSDFEPLVRKIKEEGIQAVAVCFLHSYRNPAHEIAAREYLQKEVPGLSVTLSHEVAREWREYERASTAVMNAYIAPKVEGYLAGLDGKMRSLGLPAVMHVMQSNGGVMTSRAAALSPINTFLSGPVGGTIGGEALAHATGRSNLICVDMGGTSFDMSLIVDGAPNIRSEAELEGIPLLLPVVDIQTIGAGGGSLAWFEGDAMRVGPQSAGAEPGPACYGRGGEIPTVTDANLVLGRINPVTFAGGRMTLDADAARSALEKAASRVGMDAISFAEGMVKIVNSRMADAIRTITIAQGVDPRRFSMVAFGGAGPMHAVWLARELEIPEVIIPWYPGTFSAWGMLQTDIRRDLVISYYRELASTRPEDLRAVFEGLEAEGRDMLRAEGIEDQDMSYARFADIRYVGQEHSVLVALEEREDGESIAEAFHETYQKRYGHCSPHDPAELVNLRVAAYGALGKGLASHPKLRAANGGDLQVERREVVFDGVSYSTQIVDRETMPPGSSISGPLIMEEATATTVVPPGYVLSIDSAGSAVITRE